MVGSLCCVHCDKDFTTSDERHQHNPIHRQSVKYVQRSGESFVVQANSQEMFVCPCGRSFTTPSLLQRHVSTICEQLHTVSCQVQANACFKDLITSAQLKRFHLAFNTNYGVVVCITCGILISDIAFHLYRKGISISKQMIETLAKAIDTFKEENNYGKTSFNL